MTVGQSLLEGIVLLEIYLVEAVGNDAHDNLAILNSGSGLESTVQSQDSRLRLSGIFLQPVDDHLDHHGHHQNTQILTGEPHVVQSDGRGDEVGADQRVVGNLDAVATLQIILIEGPGVVPTASGRIGGIVSVGDILNLGTSQEAVIQGAEDNSLGNGGVLHRTQAAGDAVEQDSSDTGSVGRTNQEALLSQSLGVVFQNVSLFELLFHD